VPALAIFIVALVIRLIHIWQIRRAPFFSVLLGDSRAYDAWARQLAQGDWLGREVFYQAPLYPYMLGAVYALAGRDLFVVRLGQAAIGSLACVLLAFAGRKLFSPRVGVIAGLTLALYAPAIFFDGLIQKSVLDVFFVCLALWLLGRLIDVNGAPLSARGEGVWWLCFGLTLGGLSLTRENSFAFIIVILAWALVRPTTREPRVARAGLVVVGLAFVLAPVAVRNLVVGGGFHITTSQFGPNFFIGNNASADGTYAALRPGRGVADHEREDATELAESAMGRSLTAAEVSSYWTRQAVDFIASHPAAWLRLLGRKVVLLWNATEMIDTESQAAHAEWSTPLRLAGFVGHFGVLVPFAVWGVIVSWPNRLRLGVLYALMASYAASVVMFYVFARYRFPLVPFLILFASAGAVGFVPFVRAASRPQIVGALASCIAVAVFTNWPTVSTEQMQAVTEINLGAALQADGRLAEATDRYRRAIAFRPDFAVAHDNLGVALAAQQNMGEAANEFRLAVRLDPESPRAHRHLGTALASVGARQEALDHLNRSVELAADDGQTHYELASVLFEAGDLAGAVDHLRTTIRLMPRFAGAYNELGIALASQGKLDDAIAQFRTALDLQPDFVDAQRNLSTAIGAPRDR